MRSSDDEDDDVRIMLCTRREQAEVLDHQVQRASLASGPERKKKNHNFILEIFLGRLLKYSFFF